MRLLRPCLPLLRVPTPILLSAAIEGRLPLAQDSSHVHARKRANRLRERRLCPVVGSVCSARTWPTSHHNVHPRDSSPCVAEYSLLMQGVSSRRLFVVRVAFDHMQNE